jgi:hypothetical protein
MHRLRRRSGRVIEIQINEDSQQEYEFKSVSILENSLLLKDDDVSRSSTCTYDLIDQSVSSNSKYNNGLRIQNSGASGKSQSKIAAFGKSQGNNSKS